MRPRLTFANVMSVIAVFIALGGASYAAFKLPKNSVGTKQLKNNAVTLKKIKKNAVNGAKVKANSLTGKDINLNKLGTVPSASVADSANALAPPEATHFVGLPGEPPFEEGSSTYPGGEGISFQPVGFFKDHEGIVHLEGIAKVTEGFIFTLPPGYRPASGVTQAAVAASSGAALIFGSGVTLKGKDVSGKVLLESGTTAVLTGVTFRAES
jgi:hypothetical protein